MLKPTTTPPGPLVIAYRGASAEAPEHTIAAFELAVDQGADAIDIAVQLSSDGHPVVLHDPTVDRTTDGTGPAAARTLRELKRLDAGGWRGPQFRGQRLQALGEVLERFRDRTRFWIRLPPAGAPGIEERVVSMLEIYDVLDRCLVQCARMERLTEVGRLNAGVPLGLIVSRPPLPTPNAEWVPLQALCPAAELLTEADMASIRHAGLACHVWTVDEPALASRLVRWGIDGVVTARPGVIRTALGGTTPAVS